MNISKYVCKYVRMYVCKHVLICVCMHERKLVFMHERKHCMNANNVFMYGYIFMEAYTYKSMCMHLHKAYKQVYMYTSVCVCVQINR